MKRPTIITILLLVLLSCGQKHEKQNNYLVSQTDSLKEDSNVVEKLFFKAEEAKAISDEFVAFINNKIDTMEKMAGGRDTFSGDFYGNADSVRNLFVIKKGNGKLIRDKLNETRQRLFEIVGADSTRIESTLYTIDEENTWEEEKLYHASLPAIFALLAKLKNDCLNTTSDIINLLTMDLQEERRKELIKKIEEARKRKEYYEKNSQI